jgi:hypothetical protein
MVLQPDLLVCGACVVFDISLAVVATSCELQSMCCR